MEPLAPWRIVAQVIAFTVVVTYCAWKRKTEHRLLLICTLGMTAYAMIQDQFSVRMSPEYFTVAHPRIEGLTDPTLLGVAWGFLGGWWGGMIMGMAVGISATVGKQPPLTVREIRPGLIALFLMIAVATIMTGGAAYLNATILRVELGGDLARQVPRETHLRFFAVACAHVGTYSSAILGSVVLSVWVGRQRGRKCDRITSG